MIIDDMQRKVYEKHFQILPQSQLLLRLLEHRLAERKDELNWETTEDWMPFVILRMK